MLTRNEQLLLIAYNDPDRFVAQVRYLDRKGIVTERTVSPVSYPTPSTVRVYCLGREAIRTLTVSCILRVKLRLAADVLAPEQLQTIMRFKVKGRA